MSTLARIRKVDHLGGLALRLSFDDGLVRDLDPDVLHGDYQPATGAGPKVLAERRLKPAG